MPPSKPLGALSSRNPETGVISTRLPIELIHALDEACTREDTSPSEMIRELVYSWVYGRSSLQAPSDGYRNARAMATQIAIAAVKRALAEMPQTHEDAEQLLHEHHGRRRSR